MRASVPKGMGGGEHCFAHDYPMVMEWSRTLGGWLRYGHGKVTAVCHTIPNEWHKARSTNINKLAGNRLKRNRYSQGVSKERLS
jgi:hypothetical protein